MKPVGSGLSESAVWWQNAVPELVRSRRCPREKPDIYFIPIIPERLS